MEMQGQTIFEKLHSQEPVALVPIFKEASWSLAPGKRAKDNPEVASQFSNTYSTVPLFFEKGEKKGAKGSYPVKVGVLLSGGQSAGGHNVICGLFDALERRCPGSELRGFLFGAQGLVRNESKVLTKETIDLYRNTGGFDMIGTSRYKIRTEQDFQEALETVKSNKLDALVVIGGDDSNTNSAFLAEHFLKMGEATTVIGVPKTIDNDFINEYIETTFGFHTAATVYSGLVSNIERDSIGSRKYWHFVKLMGRDSSHIVLETALQSQPTMTLISEEIQKKGEGLTETVSSICDLIEKRAKANKNYGVVIFSEGLLDFFSDTKALLQEISNVMGSGITGRAEIEEKLPSDLAELAKSLPAGASNAFFAPRDPHGNIQFTKIDTGALLVSLVENELARRGTVPAFNAVSHSFGYEGRDAFPTGFDSRYTYNLGTLAQAMIEEGLTGHIAFIQNLSAPISEWKVGALPITSIMFKTIRHGGEALVIQRRGVDLNGLAFKELQSQRELDVIEDHYRFVPGIQHFGPEEVVFRCSEILRLESGKN